MPKRKNDKTRDKATTRPMHDNMEYGGSVSPVKQEAVQEEQDEIETIHPKAQHTYRAKKILKRKK